MEERRAPSGRRIVKSPNIYMSTSGSSPAFTEAKLEADYSLIEELDARLAGVEGQAFATQAVKEYLFGVNNRENARGVGGLMVFLGPPAVGKTMMGEGIAEALHRPFLRLDMSSFNDHEVGLCDLFGVNKSYKAADRGGLTSFVEENPVSVILLDEFEKAHANVHNRFLQIFDRGEARDLYTERNVSFRDVIFIVTMNLGQELYERELTTYHLSDTPQKTIVEALRAEIDPQKGTPFLSDALVSRLASGRIILFNKLRPEHLQRITAAEIGRCREYYRDKYGIETELDPDLLAMLILLSLGEGADVRTAIKAAREFFERNIERLVKTDRAEGRKPFTRLRIEADLASEDAQSILRSGKSRVLVCCGRSQREMFKEFESEKLEMIFAKKDDSPEKLAEESDVSMAILDAGEEKKLFSLRLFDALTAQEVIPVYVYDKKEKSDVRLLYYPDHGAADVLGAGRDLKEWTSGLLKGLELTAVSQTLFRAGKALGFDVSYSFESPRTAVLTVGSIGAAIAHEAGDSEKFVSERQIPNVHFDDVYGAAEAKEELGQMLELIKEHKKYRRLGLRPPRGILLEGDPGTGKTMLAKAFACEAGLPFLYRNASELGQKYVGEGARLVRETFAVARRYAPAIVFIDEVDTFAKIREGEAREWAADVLNAFLSEMDGFKDNSATPVFVIAATNFGARRGESVLDPAFLRRFDRKIHIEPPDLDTRRRYLSDCAAKYGCETSERMLENIAKRSIGWPLGELDNVFQSALRRAVCAGKTVTDDLLNEAFARYADGASRERDEEKLQKTAVHEAGHAVVASLLGVAPSYATIGARGNYGGYVYYGDETVTGLSREECLDRIAIMTAGREAEVLCFGDEGFTTGYSGDLRSATELATSMLCDYGMDEEFPVYLSPERRKEAAWVEERVALMLRTQAERARELLNENRGKLEAVAKALLDRVDLDETDLKRLIEEK